MIKWSTVTKTIVVFLTSILTWRRAVHAHHSAHDTRPARPPCPARCAQSTSTFILCALLPERHPRSEPLLAPGAPGGERSGLGTQAATPLFVSLCDQIKVAIAARRPRHVDAGDCPVGNREPASPGQTLQLRPGPRKRRSDRRGKHESVLLLQPLLRAKPPPPPPPPRLRPTTTVASRPRACPALAATPTRALLVVVGSAATMACRVGVARRATAGNAQRRVGGQWCGTYTTRAHRPSFPPRAGHSAEGSCCQPGSTRTGAGHRRSASRREKRSPGSTRAGGKGQRCGRGRGRARARARAGTHARASRGPGCESACAHRRLAAAPCRAVPVCGMASAARPIGSMPCRRLLLGKHARRAC